MSPRRASQSKLLLVPLLFGCGSPAPTWRDALAQLDLTQSVFSLAYVATPPDGTFFTIAANAGSSATEACAAYETQHPSPDFWYLGVDTTSTPLASYAVVDRISPPSATPSATVKLVHVRGATKVETVGAVRGEVTITAAPQNSQQWHDNGLFQGTINVEFPVEPWREQMCAGGQGAGQPNPVVTSCDCIGPNGQTAQCVPATPTENCCAMKGMSAGTMPFSAAVMAIPCPWMCKFTDPALARECLALQ
jgi:hypothetical protein